MKTPRDIGLSQSDRVFFIAEAGINHNGSVSNARKLIDLAHRAGADAVKFQKRNIRRILCQEGLDKLYQTPNSFGETYGEHKEFLELDKQQYQELKTYADKVGIPLVASGWDEESVDFLYELGVPFFANSVQYSIIFSVNMRSSSVVGRNASCVLKTYGISAP